MRFYIATVTEDVPLSTSCAAIDIINTRSRDVMIMKQTKRHFKKKKEVFIYLTGNMTFRIG